MGQRLDVCLASTLPRPRVAHSPQAVRTHVEEQGDAAALGARWGVGLATSSLPSQALSPVSLFSAVNVTLPPVTVEGSRNVIVGGACGRRKGKDPSCLLTALMSRYGAFRTTPHPPDAPRMLCSSDLGARRELGGAGTRGSAFRALYEVFVHVYIHRDLRGVCGDSVQG